MIFDPADGKCMSSEKTGSFSRENLNSGLDHVTRYKKGKFLEEGPHLLGKERKTDKLRKRKLCRWKKEGTDTVVVHLRRPLP